MSSTMSEFSSRLAILVELLGGQSEIARRAGVSQAQISHMVRGERCPLLSTAIALAKGAGVGLDWLAGLSGRISLQGPLDQVILKLATQWAKEIIAEHEIGDDKGLPITTKAEIVAQHYESIQRSGRRPKREAVMEIIKRAAWSLGRKSDEKAGQL